MSIVTIQKMEALKAECENQVITDGSHGWGDLRNSLEAAIAYQREKSAAAVFRSMYGGAP